MRPVRRSLVSRALAAVLGGYALTSLATTLLALLLGLAGVDRAQALLGATMASFLLYAAIVMAAFHARSTARAWSWVIGAGLPLALLVWLLLPGARA